MYHQILLGPSSKDNLCLEVKVENVPTITFIAILELWSGANPPGLFPQIEVFWVNGVNGKSTIWTGLAIRQLCLPFAQTVDEPDSPCKW